MSLKSELCISHNLKMLDQEPRDGKIVGDKYLTKCVHLVFTDIVGHILVNMKTNCDQLLAGSKLFVEVL